jgi:hypothetical protein
MKTLKLPTLLAGALLIGGVSSTACVADRPSRNSVFNENQYVRKDFLITGVDANGNATNQNDPGWMVRATVMETATPNLVGNPQTFGVYPGRESEINLVRFRVTSDKLQMLDQIQFSNPQNPGPAGGSNFTGVTDAIINAWSASNVDLKYAVSLDGEKTNQYTENQELDWQVRQWVKLQFDKNDFSDLAPLGPGTTGMVSQCAAIADASTTLVDGSFNVVGTDTADISDDYFEFTIQIAMPMNFSDATCLQAMGASLAEAERIGRTSATVNLKYSFKRATPVGTATSYTPFALPEKDPIKTKYGPWLTTVWNRDPATSLIAATQYVDRWDPTKPLVWYFAPGFPEYYKNVFIGDANNPGIMAGTNKVLSQTGNKIQINFLNYNDATSYKDGAGPSRNFGDIRYNMLRWISDQDTEDLFAGSTETGVDPRTGEQIHGSITYNDFAVRDYYVQRLDAFLQQVGASAGIDNPGWKSGSCTTGATAQIVNQTVIDKHNATSTLYVKMQSYLGLHGPNPSDDHLGPQDFTAKATEDQDFMNAYLTLVPYEVFQDPDANLFVTREGGQGVYGTPTGLWQALQGEQQFQALAAQINKGQDPTNGGGIVEAAAFAQQMKAATTAHQWYKNYTNITTGTHLDAPGAFSFETVAEQDAQACVGGQWQTQAQWIQSIIDAYWQQVFWHEFGHSMGLSHQFMGNIDVANFTPQLDAGGKPVMDANGNALYEQYSSSVMEYNATPARLAWHQDWGSYDKGAIGWMYANNGKQPDDTKKDAAAAATLSRSGELAGAAAGQEYPYKDPLGFCNIGTDKTCPTPALTNAPQTGLVERAFIRCDDTMTKYTPLCQQGDLGTTPSQIMANSIDQYEWQYQWRNFRDYRKVWDESAYANEVAGFVVDMRRFLSQWAFDWSPAEISTLLYRVGVTPPVKAGGVSAVDYYNQLTYKFLVEMDKANEMIAAFSEAIIQQAAGERPYATVYDKFYGDVTQQGIILDKYFAMQGFVGLWQANNYDQNQAGAYLTSWSSLDLDDSYQSVAETAISSMIGSQYAVYPYFIPTAVALFAQDTHNPSFLGGNPRVEAKDWIGGWTFGNTDGPDAVTSMIGFFKEIAATAGGYTDVSGAFHACPTALTCDYDPTDPNLVFQQPGNLAFTGPDGLNYVYAFIASRNQYVLAREDRNIVTWKLIQQFNNDIFLNKDDGTNGTYALEYEIKYTIDAYNMFESGNPVPPAPAPAASSSGN